MRATTSHVHQKSPETAAEICTSEVNKRKTVCTSLQKLAQNVASLGCSSRKPSCYHADCVHYDSQFHVT